VDKAVVAEMGGTDAIIVDREEILFMQASRLFMDGCEFGT
jgi:hypothetical protein